MRKQDLIRVVAQQTGLSDARTATVVNAVFETIQRTIADGDEVNISGFGAFRVAERPARQGRNPRTGDAMTIAARRSPAFRPGTQLKRAVGSTDPE